jgi:hypothetical protein
MTKGQEQGPPIWEFEGMQHHVEMVVQSKDAKKVEQYDLVPDDLMCFRVSVGEISLGLSEKPWIG